MSLLMRVAAFAVLNFLVSFSSSLAQEPRQFLVAPFLCQDGDPLPHLAATGEKYLHEIRDIRQTQHEVCALVEQFQILRTHPGPLRRECQTFDLVSYRLMCRGAAVSAAELYAASAGAIRSGAHLVGETLEIPVKGGGGWSIGPNGPGISGLRLGERSVSYAALPPGYGFSLNLPLKTLTLPWSVSNVPAASNRLPQTIAEPKPAPLWVRLLAAWYPWPQIALGLPLLAYGLITVAGLRSAGPPVSGMTCLLALAAALLCLALTREPAGLPDAARKTAEAELARARAQEAAGERDRAELAKLIRISTSTGMVEPIAVSDVQRITQLTRTRTLAAPQSQQTNPALWAAALLSPALVFILFYVVAFMRGWHYLFVPHPAAVVATPALRRGTLFEAEDLGHALRPSVEDLYDHPPAYKSWNLFKRARALREKIEADADIADAAMRRDRAKAQQMQAQAELRALRKKLPWWQRWIWW